MYNLSETFKDSTFQKGIAEGITKEHISAVNRIILANAGQEIIFYGNIEAEYAEAVNSMYVN